MKTLTFIFLFSTIIYSQNGESMKTKTVDIFKNGTAFFTLEGKLPLQEKKGTIDDVPKALFGTFWIAPLEKNISIEEIKTYSEKKLIDQSPSSLFEILKANINKKIVWYTDKEKISGVLISVEGKNDNSPVIVTLKSEKQVHVFTTALYNMHVEFPEGYNNQKEETKNFLTIKTNSSQSEIPITMMYLQNGILWTPNYRIDLLDEKKAQIVLSANIINDAQDLENANINFVVGFPHFKFSNTLFPLDVQQTLAQFMQVLSGGYNPYSSIDNTRGGRRDIMFNQSSTASFDDDFSEENFAQFSSLEGTSAEDLFFYHQPAITLKKGERGMYNIFSAVVPYKHIYEISLPNSLKDNRYQSQNNQKELQQVWHSLKLENTSKHPWTTGSGITFQDGKPLGQDILYYTPTNSSTSIKITVSPDISVKDEEKEIKRKTNLKEHDGYYDLITVEGEIKIKNSKDKDIVLQISRPITGKILETSNSPKIRQIAGIDNGINKENFVQWEIEIKAQKEKIVTYSYEAYISR